MLIKALKTLFGWVSKDASPKEVKPPQVARESLPRLKPATTLGRTLSYDDFNFVREVIDSCKLETQIESARNWITYMYRRNYCSTEVFNEIMHHAMYKEKKILEERIQREFICPHLKKRANEIIEEERKKNIRIVKDEEQKADIK